MRLICFVFVFITFSLSSYSQIRISGYISEGKSSETIAFANIFNDSLTVGTFSNEYGYYSIKIPVNGKYKFRISAIGFSTLVKFLEIKKDTVLNFDLESSSIQLNEVTILSEDNSTIQTIGVTRFDQDIIKNTPTLLGEKDVIKTIQLLPGIQRGTEGSTALYVRGGSLDQNLIILDEAQLYNANHLFGFFSVFNGDAIKNVQFWKSGFPSQYGGRVSSVIDIQMKEGNKKEIKGEGGIGIISSRLMVEGPLIKNKSSFLLSGRRSYLDLLIKPFMSPSDQIGYSLYDLYTKLNFDLNQNNKIYFSAYSGKDMLTTDQVEKTSISNTEANTRLGWGNLTGTFRWNHIFNKRIFSNTTLLLSRFNFNLSDDLKKTGAQPRFEYTDFESSIRDYSIKNDVEYFMSNKHFLKGGYIYTFHRYEPKAYRQIDKVLNTRVKSFERYNNHEIGIYAEDLWQPNAKTEIRFGLRYNMLLTPYKTFRFIEPRINISYELFKNLSVSGSYMRANQFVHLLSNTGIGLSTDLWVPATLKAPPTQTDQISSGLIKKFPDKKITVSIEAYRKYLRNILTYKEGANFLIISEAASDISWENNVTKGKGLAYGTEFMIQKSDGKLTGWIAYTLSWTIHNFDSLNSGKNFYAKYDSRHMVSSTITYKFTPKIILSINWVYNSGNAFNAPKSYYYINTSNFAQDYVYTNVVPYFGSRNSFRADAYHRLDIAVQLHKKKKKYERYWEFGIFNAYNRNNPFYYYLKISDLPSQNTQVVTLKKKSLFPILPSVSYNIKF
ncbi:MAG: TonB-dependent receptor [Cytophagales bacterium]|nr:TonB-dependent receptor [Cytophagales bacterium]